MAIDEIKEQATHSSTAPSASSGNQKVIAVVVILVALVIGEIYSFTQISSTQKSLQTQQEKMWADLTSEMSNKLLAVERTNADQLEAIKEELDDAAKRLGSQRRELYRARTLVSKVETEKNKQIDDLKHEIALKADQEQLAALNQDVSSTKSDLDTTKKNVDTLANDYGMTKTKYGTLIARNHQEVVELRKLGQRNYYEFTITRNRPSRVGGIGLTLKKTNVKHHRFNIIMLVDDMQIEKKDRTIDEPIFFLIRGSRSFNELVVNHVDKNRITGYISTPKYGAEMASRSEGTE